MSYTSRTLMPGENVLYEGYVSSWYFAPSLILAVAGALTLMLAFMPDSGTPSFMHADGNETAGALMIAGVVILLLGLFKLLKVLFYKWTSEFIITDKRCVLKRGLVGITVSDIALDKCEGIAFRQSIAGRMFGYGTLYATTGGQTLEFPGIASPFVFRNHLFIAMDNYKKSK